MPHLSRAWGSIASDIIGAAAAWDLCWVRERAAQRAVLIASERGAIHAAPREHSLHWLHEMSHSTLSEPSPDGPN